MIHFVLNCVNLQVSKESKP
jgi:hypothetical protein